MPGSETSASTVGTGKRRESYWKHMVNRYEKRNASLERRQAALKERIHFMECTLPSLMMGAVVNMKRSTNSSKLNFLQNSNDLSSCNEDLSKPTESREKAFQEFNVKSKYCSLPKNEETKA